MFQDHFDSHGGLMGGDGIDQLIVLLGGSGNP